MRHFEDDAQIGIAISLLYRKGNAFLDVVLKQTGIGAGQHPYLLALADRESMRQDEFVQLFHVDKANVTRMVKRLCELGYVVRDNDPDDGRASRCSLTAKGRAVLPEIETALVRWYETMLAPLSDSERAVFVRCLTRIAQSETITMSEWNELPTHR